MTAEDIASRIKDGDSCVTDIAAAIPPAILNALAERAASGKVQGITLHSMLDLEPMKWLDEKTLRGITPVSWFSGSGLARLVNKGKADIMPCYYRDMPAFFRDDTKIDDLLVCVSPMDKHGYFSTGATGSNSAVQIRKARRIFLEVNSYMPRAVTAPQIHISQIAGLCENNAELPVLPPAHIDDVSRKIGEYIAEEVPNGATLQIGIGAVPDAVCQALKDKQDLGLHTELFTDGMVELIERGVVTNEKKPLNRGKTVATLAFGSKRIYDYIDDNPMFLMLPVDYVNDPAVIASHPDFISVNAALEVDFYGQVCAESIGKVHVSGTGGQSDYVRGAVQSAGGKSFIAFPSTAKGGTISRIRPVLSPGALVSTSKNDVDRIVTEYGIARLRGCTLSQRTKELIRIAHPKFREELIYEAKKENILI